MGQSGSSILRVDGGDTVREGVWQGHLRRHVDGWKRSAGSAARQSSRRSNNLIIFNSVVEQSCMLRLLMALVEDLAPKRMSA